MCVAVRRAVPNDAAVIAAIHVQTSQAAYREILPDELLDRHSVESRERFWRETLSLAEPPPVYVAELANTAVGFCAVEAPSRDEDAGASTAEIAAIYVLTRAWRNGVGSALMDAASADLCASGWRSVTLWVVAENQPALDFYAHLGFRADGAEADAGSGSTKVRLRASLAR
jgi:ribosomal protein S18 acetylase RimI-like enzyme